MGQVEVLNLHNKQVRHKRTGVIRVIFILEDNETPSGYALKRGYDPITSILFDTYLNNIQFYDLIN